jgi:hypothetical protein
VKKAAFFVEGQTELMFVRRLLEEIAGARHIAFREERRHAKTYIVLSSGFIANQSYFVLIVDCCSDGAVASAIIERHAGLGVAGYDLILGLRDLYPLRIADLAALKAGLARALPTTAPKTHREWFSSRLLDAGRDHGEGLHFEPAGNIEAGIAAFRVAERDRRPCS